MKRVSKRDVCEAHHDFGTCPDCGEPLMLGDLESKMCRHASDFCNCLHEFMSESENVQQLKERYIVSISTVVASALDIGFSIEKTPEEMIDFFLKDLAILSKEMFFDREIK